jgi:hypothetical protein
MTDVLTVLESFTTSVIELIPNLIGAIILLVIGWIIGMLVGKAVKKVLTAYDIDSRIGGEKPTIKLSSILPKIITWTIYLVFIQSAVEVLGIESLVEVVGAIIAFIPGLIGAIIVVLAGFVLGNYVNRQVRASKMAYADLVGTGLFFLAIYVSVALALPLVGLDPTLINNILLLLVASVALGLGIALGLGGKDAVADLIKTYQKKMEKEQKS